MLLAVAVAAAVMLPASAASVGQKPRVLTAIADIGTVYWRDACPRGEPRRWSLGVRLFQEASSTGVTFRAGALVLRRDLNVPDGKTAWFPFRRNGIQQLTLESGGGAGNHDAKVRVNFGSAGCFPWQTPDITTRTFVAH